jgi:putative transposase
MRRGETPVHDASFQLAAAAVLSNPHRLLLWDGLRGHKSAEMRMHLAGQRHWLTAERLPGYAPDSNPVERVFGNVKGRKLADHCGPALPPATALRTGLARVRRRPPTGPGVCAPSGSRVVICASLHYTRLARCQKAREDLGHCGS